MPNYIRNRLIINGSKEEIEEVKNFLRTDDEEGSLDMDFRNITPIPKWVYQGNLGKREEEKYGKENCWYDWCCKNWGTKWNACSATTYGNVIEFETAWCGVPELMQKLAMIFPNIEFEYMYADEDIGNNAGHFDFKDTDVNDYSIENCSKEAYELAFDLWGLEDEYVWNEKTQEYEWKYE